MREEECEWLGHTALGRSTSDQDTEGDTQLGSFLCVILLCSGLSPKDQ